MSDIRRELRATIEDDMAIEIGKSVVERPVVKTTEALLNEREKTHGDYTEHAQITQSLKHVLYGAHLLGPASDVPYSAYAKLNPCQREALDMIAHKIGRILAGDPDFRDHWDDIAGYAKLVADRCSK